MPSRVLHVKRNDTTPVVGTITKNGVAQSLAGATVRFLMWQGNSLKVDGTATPDPDQVTNKGKVVYSPAVDDFDTADEYHQEWEVTFVSGVRTTFPEVGYNTVIVEPDLG
jgi:hypothetical protein